LLKVLLDIIKVLNAHRYSDQIRGNATLNLLLVGELLVGRDPRVDDERLSISNIGKMGTELEVVNYRSDLVNVASLEFWVSNVSSP
jgi:hypothetical protein